MGNKIIGRWGETTAAEYLVKKGYKLIAQGYRSRYGEIDLIVSDRKYIVFVEVKTRKNAHFARAMEYVDKSKQRRISATADLWLAGNKTNLQPRFDVIEIYYGNDFEKPQINHIENAFGV